MPRQNQIGLGTLDPVVDVLTARNTISGPAITYQVNPRNSGARQFHSREVARQRRGVLEVSRPATPVIPMTAPTPFAFASRNTALRSTV